MHLFADFDEALVRQCVDEFSAATGIKNVFSISCLDRSANFSDERFVFVLARPDGSPLVLKLDTAEGTTRLTKEYGIIEKLRSHFDAQSKVALVEPVYLSPTGRFHVTEFLEGKTAKQIVYSPQDLLQAGQVFRRGGEWLNHLHNSDPPAVKTAWFNWMLEEIESLVHTSQPQACARQLGGFVAKLAKDCQRLSGAPCIATFSHGDFHGGNLVLGRGVSYGLDFTEASTKLAIYDIVDFLKMDAFLPAEPSEIGASGIRNRSTEMFFKKYRHNVNFDLLTCAMRGRLLIDWVKISREAFARSEFLRKKFRHLDHRLSTAFAQPLDT
ncbi:phosphotransferase family protein [Leisingera sp. ANG59]|uniref:phosphotransferase family protein n=1 Tax=Leisingera sp. ANG59 TaxID=2675221 RepID=UPI0015748776|nr:phosphotransferase [Leisingera sp. ANG59]NSY36819.1 phosphotransferase [Leisingera sp. ANG59]